MPGRLIEMSVESVRVHMLSTQHVVILRELERDRYLPIWIGAVEATAIAFAQQGGHRRDRLVLAAGAQPLDHEVARVGVGQFRQRGTQRLREQQPLGLDGLRGDRGRRRCDRARLQRTSSQGPTHHRW